MSYFRRFHSQCRLVVFCFLGVFSAISSAFAQPEIALSADTLEFSSVKLGRSGTQTFFIWNMGNENLVVDSIASDRAEFTVDPTLASIARGQSREVRVTFRPTAIGSQSATITITSNDSDEGKRTVKVMGSVLSNVNWDRTDLGRVVNCPAIQGGTVYVGSDDGHLYALNVDASIKWKFQLYYWVDTNFPKSSPAVGSDGTVYIGSLDSCLYAINADSTLKWKYKTGYRIYSSPAIGADGTIYFGSGDGYFYALNPDSTLKWKYWTGGRIECSPAIGADGTIYFGSGYLYALNPDSTLKWRWRYDETANVSSSPAIGADGIIYFGSIDGNLYALNPDGSYRWQYQTGAAIRSSPAIGSDGAVYFGSDDNNLYALNADGSYRWQYQTGDDVYSSPAIGEDGTLYFGSWDSYFYALKDDGSLKWKYQSGLVFSSPALDSDGTVYFGTSGTSFYSLDSGTDAGLAEGPWPKFHGNTRNTGNFLDIPGNGGDSSTKPAAPTALTATAQRANSINLSWTDNSDNEEKFIIWYNSPDIAGFNRLCEVGVNATAYTVNGLTAGAMYTFKVEAFNSAGGNISSEVIAIPPDSDLGDAIVMWIFQAFGDVYSSPAIGADGTVYFGTGPGSKSLYALNADGSPKWKYQTRDDVSTHTSGSIYSSPTIGADGTVYFGCDDSCLYALNAGSTLKWKYQTGGAVNSSPAIGADGTVYFGSDDGHLYALNANSTLKWKYKTGGKVSFSPAIGADGTVYFGSEDSCLYALWAYGSLKWKYNTGDRVSSSSPAIGADGTVYFGSVHRHLYALNAAGNLLWDYETPGSGTYGPISSPAIGADGTVYFGAGEFFYALNADGSAKWNYGISGMKQYSPAIGAEGTIYFTSSNESPHSVSYLYALNANGSLNWRYSINVFFPSCSPAIAEDGTIYFGDDHGFFYAVNTGTGAGLADSPWPKFHGNTRNTGNILDNPGYGGGTTAEPEIALSADSLEFGTVSLGSSGTRTFYIRNEGSAALAVSAIASDNGAFTVDPTSATVAPGDSQAVNVTFSPTAFGSQSATITLTSNDADEATVMLSVAGTAGLAQKWTYQSGGWVFSSPAIGSAGMLYFGSDDNYLYALQSDGSLKWRYETGADVSSSPAIGADGAVYVGSYDSYFYAFHADGSLKWQYQAGGGVYSSPAIGVDGTVYFGSNDGNLYALDSDGSLKWQYHTGGPLHSSPAVGADGTVYFGSFDHYLYALNPDGSLKWNYQTDALVRSCPAIGGDGAVYFGSADSCLYALHSDGSLKWKFRAGAQIWSSPAIGEDGMVYFGSHDNYLYALHSDGSPIWNYQTGGVIWTSPAIGRDNTVYIASNDGFLYAVNADGTFKASYQIGGKINSSPGIGPDGVLYVGSEDGKLHAIDILTGAGLADSPWPKFHHDAQNTGSIQIQVPEPDIDLSLTEIAFGVVTAGDSASVRLAITNLGSAELTVSNIESDNPVFICYPTGISVPQGDTAWIDVNFIPVEVGPQAGTLTVTSNDPDEGTLLIPVSGKGVPNLPTSTADIADDFEDGNYNGWTVDDPDVWEVAGGALQQKTAVSFMGYGSFQHFAQWDLGEIAGDFTLTLNLGFNENAYPMIAPDSLDPTQVHLRDFGLGIRQSQYDLLIAMLTHQQARRNGIIKFKDGLLSILYAVNDDPEYIHSQEMGLDIHEMRPMKISRYNGVITVWADGEVIYQASDTTSSDPVDAGWVCFTGRGPVGVRLDNVVLSSSADPPPAFSPPAAVTDLTFELEEGAGHIVTSEEGYRGTTDAGSTNPGSFMGWWVDEGVTPGSKSWAAAAGLVTVARNLTLGPQATIEGWFKFFKGSENIFSINFDGYLIDQSWGRERSYMSFRDWGADGKRLMLLLQGTTVTPGPDPDIVSDYYFDGDPSPVVNINFGEWTHVSWVRDGSLHTVYVNGCKIGSMDMPRWGSATLTGVTLVAGNNANYGISRQIGAPPYAYIDRIKVTSQAIVPTPDTQLQDLFADIKPELLEHYVGFGLTETYVKQKATVLSGDLGSNGNFTLGVNGELNSNVITGKDLQLKSGAVLNGNATYGGNLILGRNASITGTVTHTTPQPFNYSVSEYTAGGQSIIVKMREIRNLAPGTYDLLQVKSKGLLTLHSGMYFFNDIDIGTDVDIRLDLSNGPLYVYVVGKLEISEKSTMQIVSATGDATQVFFIILGRTPKGGTSTSFIGVKTGFLGSVIAPNSEILVKENAKVDGALYAKILTLGVNTTIGFSRAPDNVLLAGAGGPAAAAELPKVFSLSQNYPNPFNPSTTIQYDVPESAAGQIVSLKVHDLRGRLVRSLMGAPHPAGRYSVYWDGRDEAGRQLSSGVYFYRLQAGEFTRTRKMVLLK
ncbi:MAG: PQQ-binding-like beta-propeller repeat protein [Candidatus Glassbacteria bacterium]